MANNTVFENFLAGKTTTAKKTSTTSKTNATTEKSKSTSRSYTSLPIYNNSSEDSVFNSFLNGGTSAQSSASATTSNNLGNYLASNEESASAGSSAAEQAVTNAAATTAASTTDATETVSEEDAAKAAKYASLSASADYDEKATPNDSVTKRNLFEDITGTGLGTNNEKLKYNYINGLVTNADMLSKGADITGVEKYKYMTDAEVANYNYLYATEGKRSANEYLDYIDDEVTSKWDTERRAENKTIATSSAAGRVAESAASTLFGVPAQALSYLDRASQWLAGKVTGDEYKEDNVTRTASELRKTRSDIADYYAKQSGTINDLAQRVTGNEDTNIPIAGNWSAGTLYSTAMSAIDSLYSAFLTGGLGNVATVASAILATGAGDAAIEEARQRGANDNQAMAYGTVKGAIEWITEKVSLDNLVSMSAASNGGELLANIMKQGGIETSEEMASGLLGMFADAILGDKSQWAEYAAQGMDAKQIITKEVQDALSEALPAFLSGAAMGGGYGTAQYVTNTNTTEQNTLNNTAAQNVSNPEMIGQYTFAQPTTAQNGAETTITSPAQVNAETPQSISNEAQAAEQSAEPQYLENELTVGEEPQLINPEVFSNTAPANSTSDNNASSVAYRPGTVSATQMGETLNGNTGTAVVSAGDNISFHYAVVDVDALKTSHDAVGNENTAYPQELQQRDRTRAASREQIARIANALDPRMVEENPLAKDGAPIVRSDGVVVGGNGRTIGISEAYYLNNSSAAEYRDYLKSNAAKWGINAGSIDDLSHPVLVRVVDGDYNMVDLSRRLNEETSARTAATETAFEDARKLTGDIIASLVVDEDGNCNLNSAANRGFVTAFIQAVVPQSEQGTVVTSRGALSQEGLLRVQNAIFAKAYGDTELVERLSELNDDDAKNVTNALLAIAPRAVTIDDSIQSGYLYDVDITSYIKAGAKLYTDSKSDGASIDDFASQIGFAGTEEYSAADVYIAKEIDNRRRSKKKIAEFFNTLYDVLEEIGDPAQASIFSFGDDVSADERSVFEAAERMINNGEYEGQHYDPENFSVQDRRVNERLRTADGESGTAESGGVGNPVAYSGQTEESGETGEVTEQQSDDDGFIGMPTGLAGEQLGWQMFDAPETPGVMSSGSGSQSSGGNGNAILFGEKAYHYGSVGEQQSEAGATLRNIIGEDDADDALTEYTTEYAANTEKSNSANAQSYFNAHGMRGSFDHLIDADMWTPADVKLVGLVMKELKAQSKSYLNSGDTLARNNVLRDMADLGEKYVAVLSDAGKVLQASQEYSISRDISNQSIIGQASKVLREAGLSDAERLQKLAEIQGYIDEIDNYQVSGDLIDIIERIAKTRGITKTIFFGKVKDVSKVIHWFLQTRDESRLYSIALHSCFGIADDCRQRNTGEYAKSLQVFSHLFNPKTWFRNFDGNLSFGGISVATDNLAAIIDIFVNYKTGTRSKGFDRGSFNKVALNGKVNAVIDSVLEIYLDTDTTGDVNRYDMHNTRTFAMNGSSKMGALNRFLSKLERNLSYALNTSDQWAKGGVVATESATLQSMIDNGQIDASRAGENYAQDTAVAESRYRTFQDESVLADWAMGAHDSLNVIGFGDSGRRTARGHTVHSFGLGDLLMPYSRVPGNIASRVVEYSPVAALKGLHDICKLNSNTSVEQQYKAVMTTARGITGTALIGLAYLIAKAGLIRNSADDDNKDEKNQNKSEGVSGLQFNLSALWRMLGGKDTEWTETDILTSLDFLQPANSWLYAGCFLDSYLDRDDTTGFIASYIDSFVDSIGDMPVLSTLNDIIQDVQYSDMGLGSAFAQEVASSALSSLVPSIVRNLATATDENQRDLYSGEYGAMSLYDWFTSETGLQSKVLASIATFLDDAAEVDIAVSSMMNSIPGLREMLPVKLDNYGQEVGYTGNRALDIANAMLLPGNTTTYRQSDLTKELSALAASTGEQSFYANRSPVSKISYKGADYTLTYEQKRQYQMIYGSVYEDMGTDIINSDYYATLTDSERVKMLSSMETVATARARYAIADAIGISGYTETDSDGSDTAKTLAKLDRLSSSGVTYSDYYQYKQELNSLTSGDDWSEMDDDGKKSAKINLLTSSDLSEKQQVALYYDLLGYSISDEKIEAGEQLGLSESELRTWRYRLDQLTANGGTDLDASELVDKDKSLNADQKNFLTNVFCGDVTVISNGLDIDYTSEDTIKLSAAGSDVYNRYKYGVVYDGETITPATFGLDADSFIEIYNKYDGYGQTVAIDAIMNDYDVDEKTATKLAKLLTGNVSNARYQDSMSSDQLSFYNNNSERLGSYDITLSNWNTLIENYSGKGMTADEIYREMLKKTKYYEIATATDRGNSDMYAIAQQLSMY